MLWTGALLVLGAALSVVVRASGHDIGGVSGYLAYLSAYVALPGTLAMYGVYRGPLSFSRWLALALPTGFAIEIFSFLGLAALGAKSAYPWLPGVWGLVLVAVRMKWRVWPVRLRCSAAHAGIAMALVIIFAMTVLMAASQMFAESPLARGLPTRAIFHDWVYLVSRAAVIKHNWPLDDPSLAGTPLQYHYFMMVHAAAASWTTRVEIGSVLLRLIYLPLGAVLVAQLYVLGRAVSRSPWGGVLAAFLLVGLSEVSAANSYGDPAFLGLFIRWLFVSPTFYFGMVFCGALLLAVAHCVRLTGCGPRHFLWVLLLGCAGTGAKGTVLPVVICALVLWILWRVLRERRLPLRLLGIAVCLAVAFSAVYVPTMSQWKTGNAFFRPYHVFELTGFWRENLPVFSQWAATWLPARVAVWFGPFACACVVFAGTCGVRLLAIPFLVMPRRRPGEPMLIGWLGSFFFASAGMGLLLELNSHGEIYVILMMRLPMSVLTAGFLVAMARRASAVWGELRAPAKVSFVRPRSSIVSALPTIVAVGVCGLAFGLQISLAWQRNSAGFREWFQTPTDLKPDGYMRDLAEALVWIRHHTEPNAVIVSNACTPENMRKDHWGALDRTLTGVHFYYSALSERRLWLEGPSYLLDAANARLRANLLSDFFYRGRGLTPRLVGSAPAYVLHDHSLRDGAVVPLPAGARLFSNVRMDIYRLTPLPDLHRDSPVHGKFKPAVSRTRGSISD